tara:strand:+ start:968 stop:1132 length:165 start_codon:yes stop_codon:yes gene_type:complete
MLFITRKKNESVKIGDATIKLIKISDRIATLGIQAPKEINIVRTELLDRKENEK